MSTNTEGLAGAGERKSQPDETMPVRLRCLSGGAMPEDLRRDGQRLDKLTDRALAALPSVLAPCVLEAMSTELGQQLSRLCVRHEVAEADLGHVIRVVRWLLREAAAADLDKAALEEDVRAIWKEPRGLAEVLLGDYEAIKQEIRRQLLQDALTKHGNVLVDVDWRVDFVAADRQASKLMSPLALVTLSYRNAESTGRLTLQLLPEQLARLQQMFGALAQRTLKPLGERQGE